MSQKEKQKQQLQATSTNLTNGLLVMESEVREAFHQTIELHEI